MQTGCTNYHNDKNDIDKACFWNDMANGKYNDLNKRTQPIKFCEIKLLASMIYKFSDKNPQVVLLNLCPMNNLQLNLINQSLENLNEEEFILHLKTKFWVVEFTWYAFNKKMKPKN